MAQRFAMRPCAFARSSAFPISSVRNAYSAHSSLWLRPSACVQLVPVHYGFELPAYRRTKTWEPREKKAEEEQKKKVLTPEQKAQRKADGSDRAKLKKEFKQNQLRIQQEQKLKQESKAKIKEQQKQQTQQVQQAPKPKSGASVQQQQQPQKIDTKNKKAADVWAQIANAV